MEGLGYATAAILLVIGASSMVFGFGQATHNKTLRSHCEFVNEAQRCYKVFLPENHEYFKEDL